MGMLGGIVSGGATGLMGALGAVAGAAKGGEIVAEQGMKKSLEEHASDLAQKREEAITRLRGSQEAAMQQTGIAATQQNVHEEIAGRAAVAQAGRTSSEKQLGEKLTSEEKRTAAHGTSMENVARIRAAATLGAAKARSAGAVKEWTPRTVNLQGGFAMNPTSKKMEPVQGRGMNVMVHRDGSQWVQAGDKLYPYDASKPDGLGIDPASTRRAPAAAVQALIHNPLGNSPSGMAMKDSFAQQYHYLPAPYLAAAEAARAKMGGSAGGGTEEQAPEATEEPENPADTAPEASSTAEPMAPPTQ